MRTPRAKILFFTSKICFFKLNNTFFLMTGWQLNASLPRLRYFLQNTFFWVKILFFPSQSTVFGFWRLASLQVCEYKRVFPGSARWLERSLVTWSWGKPQGLCIHTSANLEWDPPRLVVNRTNHKILLWFQNLKLTSSFKTMSETLSLQLYVWTPLLTSSMVFA